MPGGEWRGCGMSSVMRVNKPEIVVSLATDAFWNPLALRMGDGFLRPSEPTKTEIVPPRAPRDARRVEFTLVIVARMRFGLAARLKTGVAARVETFASRAEIAEPVVRGTAAAPWHP